MNLFLLIVLAASLPTFDDFRRADHERRTTGQFQTAESMRLTQIDAGLIVRTASQHADDPQMLWGAAELLADWSKQEPMFESALRASGTNVAVALRFACAAAQHSDFGLAVQWLRPCEQKDEGNTAPPIAELWALRRQRLPEKLSHPPQNRPADFRDYSVEATRARIKLLEAAGYSPYSARRVGFNPGSILLSMARDLGKPPVADDALPLLQDAAKAMQRGPTFLLTEFVGQSIERNLLALRKDAATNEEVQSRVADMNGRREALKELVAAVERNTIDLATEQQMVNYFDNVLSLGEETAMKKLAEAVRHGP
jgi:hypothetical protein